ncbi:glycosyltransferase family 4 protein [Marinifilum fragile]|uniref:glycosyltransferase family 4 protein n=1 Tax=Marinifilum fragile TaxID=570161 RepID=UPI0006D1E6AB|nr:glycosyltransferase family 4 protein [Marinifilum fragile]
MNSGDNNDICFISDGYPYKGEAEFTFVAQLVEAIADTKTKCIVIAPQSITRVFLSTKNKRPTMWKYKTDRGNEITVYQPLTLTFSRLRVFGESISYLFARFKINKILNGLRKKPSVIYGHFWQNAYAGFPFAYKNRIPLFVATGESKIWIQSLTKFKDKDKFVSFLSGVIAVSTKNKEESIQLGLLKEDKCKILPNGIDKNKFYKKEQKLCREKLNFPQEVFVVCFVGAFIERKGVLRVNDAVNSLNDSSIKCLLIGKGEQEPEQTNLLFSGSLPHDKLVDYLNASDVFVLPTLNEGCCNAIVEAMACGLPVISSDRSFNHDILNDRNAILVEPSDIGEIANAIDKLKKDASLRSMLSRNALETAKDLSVEHRAKLIVEFIKEKL